MELNPPPPPLEPPPPPPPDSAWWTPPLSGPQWGWPATPLPPPIDSPQQRHTLLILVSVVASVAVVAVLAIGFVAASRQVRQAVPPDIIPGLSLPPIPTPPPVTDVQPLPSALPAGSAVPNAVWTQANDGVVSVVPTNDGVELTLVKLGQEEIVPIPVPSPLPALRVDTSVTATTDSNGNEIGVACTTADRSYGARFSITANGDRFMWLNWPGGPTRLNGIQPGAVHDITTVNQLSAVCIEHSKSFEMMFAINGTVVADDEVPQMTTQPLYPALYICSCHGHEATHNSAIAVSSLPTGG